MALKFYDEVGVGYSPLVLRGATTYTSATSDPEGDFLNFAKRHPAEWMLHHGFFSSGEAGGALFAHWLVQEAPQYAAVDLAPFAADGAAAAGGSEIAGRAAAVDRAAAAVAENSAAAAAGDAGMGGGAAADAGPAVGAAASERPTATAAATAATLAAVYEAIGLAAASGDCAKLAYAEVPAGVQCEVRENEGREGLWTPSEFISGYCHMSY